MAQANINDPNVKEIFAALHRQNKEFDALTKLAEEWERLRRVAVVDDFYPEARHKYESALKTFIDALKINGRI